MLARLIETMNRNLLTELPSKLEIRKGGEAAAEESITHRSSSRLINSLQTFLRKEFKRSCSSVICQFTIINTSNCTSKLINLI